MRLPAFANLDTAGSAWTNKSFEHIYALLYCVLVLRN